MDLFLKKIWSFFTWYLHLSKIYEKTKNAPKLFKPLTIHQSYKFIFQSSISAYYKFMLSCLYSIWLTSKLYSWFCSYIQKVGAMNRYNIESYI
jgi:hypothetical protein